MLQWRQISPEKVHKDQRLEGFELEWDSQAYVLVTLCAKACMQRTSCKSFNFHVSLGMCQLNTKTAEDEPQAMEDSEGFDYYPKESWVLNEVSMWGKKE